MSAGSKLIRMLMAGLLFLPVLFLPVLGFADTPAHRTHKAKKPLPPLPSGPRGPVPQVPLDAIPAVPPTVSYQGGMLTIVAPNSTLGDILRGVRKHTSANIDIPASANERVATHLGPGPAHQVMAELLNGSHFNYILLGSPQNADLLVRVVLVAKTGPDNPPPPATDAKDAASANASEPDANEEPAEETPDQSTVESEQAPSGDQPPIKTPQQLLQEMQQRQLQMQQQQGQQPQPQGQQGMAPSSYPPPGGAPQPPPQDQH